MRRRKAHLLDSNSWSDLHQWASELGMAVDALLKERLDDSLAAYLCSSSNPFDGMHLPPQIPALSHTHR